MGSFDSLLPKKVPGEFDTLIVYCECGDYLKIATKDPDLMRTLEQSWELAHRRHERVGPDEGCKIRECHNRKLRREYLGREIERLRQNA